ncbi:uncharacterized protein LOC116249915 isoform X1 [Nymphaea colorata]|nr:uncharacterized protein LOC116249915 isoform X1 [Nymphaea colorata]
MLLLRLPTIPRPLLWPFSLSSASPRFLTQSRKFGFCAVLPSRPIIMANTEGSPQEIRSGDGAQNDGEREKGKGGDDEVIIQYVVLRRDLIDTWPLGSVVTQGCHASVSAIWLHKDDEHTAKYCAPTNLDSMHKVTLEVKGEVQLVNLSEKLKAAGIAYKLWIEQPENFPTCLATKPYPKSTVSPFFRKLKLCK